MFARLVSVDKDGMRKCQSCYIESTHVIGHVYPNLAFGLLARAVPFIYVIWLSVIAKVFGAINLSLCFDFAPKDTS